MVIIKHPDYKLSVGKAINGDYLVNFYYKIPDKTLKGLEGVINFMGQLEKSVIANEPSLNGLPEEDKKVIMAVRDLMLARL